MANWCNLRLVAIGRPKDVRLFQSAAGPVRGRIRSRQSEIFTADMEIGEGGDLEADGAARFSAGLMKATYRFQGQNDDYVDHFASVSRRFPQLALILVASDPNNDSHGSYFLCKGRQRWWEVSERRRAAILKRRYRQFGLTTQTDIDDDATGNAAAAEYEAEIDFMDVAQQHWHATILRRLAVRTHRRTTRRD